MGNIKDNVEQRAYEEALEKMKSSTGGFITQDNLGYLTGIHPNEDVYDNVNKPKHYNSFPGVEVIQITEHLNFCRGNCVKYVARAGLKNKDTEVEDLKKALWYLKRELKRLGVEE